MVPNPLLSITIPTFNRADLLNYCLELHIPIAREHNIQIFISDNASTDLTRVIVEARKKEYPLIQYYRNDQNVGFDKNFELALKYPDTEYVWLLGDTYQIPSDALRCVLTSIKKKKYDAIVMNVASRVKNIDDREYNDCNLLLSDLGWHMTCLASLIYNKQVIAVSNPAPYQNSYFLQAGILLDYLSQEPFLLLWLKSFSLLPIQIPGVEKKSWQNETFEVWAVKWPNFIFSLPKVYTLKVKLKCIKEHGPKSKLFSVRSLLLMRAGGLLSYKTYKQYKNEIPLVINYDKYIVLLISLMPQFLFKVAVLFLRMFRKDGS
ncbi:MAG: glycosyltransferase family 2 protein [Ghiorsea sp.]